jgi:hypothetical protein
MPALFAPFWQSNNIYDSSLHHLHEISFVLKSSADVVLRLSCLHMEAAKKTPNVNFEILPARMSYIDRQQVHKPV